MRLEPETGERIAKLAAIALLATIKKTSCSVVGTGG
jgi:hypothetical protein